MPIADAQHALEWSDANGGVGMMGIMIRDCCTVRTAFFDPPPARGERGRSEGSVRVALEVEPRTFGLS
eukprot:3322476-Prymnesium_polylepis.1